MNYQEALEYIHGTYKFGSKLGLENINNLLDLMGNPQKDLRIIHVAGTNGKGSTSSFIASVLKKAGYKVGLYTSPYLEEFTERIRINGENIPKKDLGMVTAFVKEHVDRMLEKNQSHPTEFEIVTAIGFEYFKRQKVDFVVLEVGLGGRFDATNVVIPWVSVLTPIDLDHTQYLGDTLGKVAYEKAGIIKENGWVVSYDQNLEAMEVIEKVCSQKHAHLIKVCMDTLKIKEQNDTGQTFDIECLDTEYKDLKIRMLGEHQIQNAILALKALEVLKREKEVYIPKKAIYEGLEDNIWPGRLEIIQKKPLFLIDGAHNLHGMKALNKVLKGLCKDKRVILGLGILADKDESMIDQIIPFADTLILTTPDNPRAMDVDTLEKKTKKHNKETIKKANIKEAVICALDCAKEEDIIVFAGSLYMIGKVRSLMKKELSKG